MVEHLLCAHRGDHVRMRRHPDVLRGHVSKKCIKPCSIAAILDRIDPDQHTIQAKELPPHLFDCIIGLDDSLGADVQLRKCIEQPAQHCLSSLRALLAAPVAAPEETNSRPVSRGHVKWMPSPPQAYRARQIVRINRSNGDDVDHQG